MSFIRTEHILHSLSFSGEVEKFSNNFMHFIELLIQILQHFSGQFVIVKIQSVEEEMFA